LPLRFSISRLLYRLVTLAVFGAAVHICIILLMPYVSQGSAWVRLADKTTINRLAILPRGPETPGPLAFMAPDVRYAVCRYDLSSGPLQLRSPLPDDLCFTQLFGELHPMAIRMFVQRRHQLAGMADHP